MLGARPAAQILYCHLMVCKRVVFKPPMALLCEDFVLPFTFRNKILLRKLFFKGTSNLKSQVEKVWKKKQPSLRENLHASASRRKGPEGVHWTAHVLRVSLVLMRLSQGSPEGIGSPSGQLLETVFALKRVRGFITASEETKTGRGGYAVLIRLEMNRGTRAISLSWGGAQCGEDTQNAQGFHPQQRKNEKRKEENKSFFFLNFKEINKENL